MSPPAVSRCVKRDENSDSEKTILRAFSSHDKMKVSSFLILPPAFSAYKTESFYSSCSPPAYITNRGKSMPGPLGSFWPIPVALKGHGAAHQRKMKVCTCFIGMFKIPHTEKTVYDDDERPDCDEIMRNNQAARLALPENLRPKYWQENINSR
jgi:hypothetical protein